ncbi:MAG: AAA family ATPase [Candidatus Thorarchaeota archaeon]|jgi:predicted kinase
MDTQKIRLDILVGNIASGKSTYCKKAAEEGAIIVNDDSIVNCVHANNYQLYSEELKPLYKSVENTILTTALTIGRSVVVDRPNHTVKMRRRYIGLAHSLDVPVRIVLFEWDKPEVHAKRRMKSDPRGFSLEYWTDVAKYFKEGLEFHRSGENYDEIVEWKFPG